MPLHQRPFKCTLLFFALVLIISPSSQADPPKGQYSVDDVVKAWEARAEKVKTLRFQWNSVRKIPRGAALRPVPNGVIDPANPGNRTVPEQDGICRTSYTLVIDGDKLRYEMSDFMLSPDQQLVPQDSVLVWRSDEYRHLLYPMALPYPLGCVISACHIEHPPEDFHLQALLLAYRPLHPVFPILGNFAKRFRVLPGTQLVEGRDCIVIESKPLPESGTVVSIVVDPERDFAVMSAWWGKPGAPGLATLSFQYEQVNGDWVPLRWAMDEGRIKERIKITSQVADFSLNDVVDPKVFELEFPPGTWVDESGSPTTYIVKEGGRRRVITSKEAVSGAKYKDFLNSESGSLARGPDTTDDPNARRETLAGIRVAQSWGLKGRSIWNFLVTKDDGVEVRVEPVGDVHPREPIVLAIDDESCEQMLFGKGRNKKAARDELAMRLRKNITAVDQVCGMGDAQKQKLEAAGRSDTDRLFERAKELRPKVKRTFEESDVKKGGLDARVVSLCDETRPLRRGFDSEAFGDDSLFSKTLKSVLTREQAAKYDEAKPKPTGNR